jgi:hypothetical protein
MLMKKITSKYSDELEDDWYFDLGYHYAFSVSIFLITLIFSSSAPLLPIFGFLFFSIKVIVIVIIFLVSRGQVQLDNYLF